MSKKRIIRAVGYVRVSTEEQAKEGLSLENQKARIEAYTKSQDWTLVDIYREEGKSGKSFNRPELSRLLSDCQNRAFDIVLVYKVDRLTRRQKHLWKILEDVFEAHQIGFKSVSEPFDTTTAQGKAFLGMLAVFAQLERDTISERTKDSLIHKKTNGEHVGRIPYGYRIGENGKLEKDPVAQKLISKAKRMRRSGRSVRAIAESLNIGKSTVHRLINVNLRSLNSHYHL